MTAVEGVGAAASAPVAVHPDDVYSSWCDERGLDPVEDESREAFEVWLEWGRAEAAAWAAEVDGVWG